MYNKKISQIYLNELIKKHLMTIKSRTERVLYVLTITIRILVFISFLWAFLEGNWVIVFLSLLTYLSTYLSYWFEKTSNVDLPVEFELIVILFLFATLFLGEIGKFYELFWWWDILLHTFSAFIFGCIGFMILFVLNQSKKIRAKPIWIVIFSFSFALAIGALWEIFEFSMDMSFGLSMQRSSLIDTMTDLIVDAIGAFVASFLGFLYLKHDKMSFVSKFTHSFIKYNPKFLGKKKNN